ncbi:MAG TPA: nuclear transport factor 2 family protein [Gemmatimonadales bacterium]|nr:nuclear transport factor 2 family protein [Gemmatimonadales bacterium]
MNTIIRRAGAAVSHLLLLVVLASPAAAQGTDELDAYWAEVGRTVAEGDFEGYGALYHPDAVLVSLGSGRSYPISRALTGWKQGFLDTAEGRAEAGVDFRLTQRLHDETTAHETGIFRYTMRSGGNATVALVHFHALLVKKDGKWLMLMEYQRGPATEEEWAAAAGDPAEE